MNALRTSEYSDRSPYRRRVDTVYSLDHLRFRAERYGERSRLPRKAILLYGLDVIDAECNEDTHHEVKQTLRALFGSFDPLAEVNKLSIRQPFDADAHGRLISKLS